MIDEIALIALEAPELEDGDEIEDSGELPTDAPPEKPLLLNSESPGDEPPTLAPKLGVLYPTPLLGEKETFMVETSVCAVQKDFLEVRYESFLERERRKGADHSSAWKDW